MALFSLEQYRLLGRSGLRVSPLALGTMTFGTEWGWGADEAQARRIFDAYVDRGGNFIDTANAYTGGTAERWVGAFAAGKRDRLIFATKYGLQIPQGDANSSGNHRKCMIRSVEGSLERLATDYLDLLYLHFWDATTPVDEVMRAMDDLVRTGKVLYTGISNTPAWQVARMQTVADLRGWSPLVALQLEYNLIERTGERDLIPMAREMGLGLVAWSPLAGGVLSGKYTEADIHAERVDSPDYSARRGECLADGTLSSRGLRLTESVRSIAAELEKSPAQLALAWTLRDKARVIPILGARTLKQLNENLDALEIELTESQQIRLDQASETTLGFPHEFLKKFTDPGLGGIQIARER